MPRDTAAGWAIIIAADYQAKSPATVDVMLPLQHVRAKLKLYECVQRDAIRAYAALVNQYGLPADHIILLSEGTLIDAFVKDVAFPQPAVKTKDRLVIPDHPAFVDNVNKWRRAIDQHKAPWLGDRIATANPVGDGATVLADMVHPYGGSSPGLPLYGAPTANNFRAARDLVSRFASPDQFVMFVVSSHAGPTAKLVTLPQTGSQSLDQSSLSAEDFRLSGCKARSRIAVLDCSLSRPQESYPAQRRQAARANQVALRTALGAPQAPAIILSAGTGDEPTWPECLWGESGFLYAVSCNYLSAPGLTDTEAFQRVQKVWTGEFGLYFSQRDYPSSVRAQLASQYGLRGAPIGDELNYNPELGDRLITPDNVQTKPKLATDGKTTLTSILVADVPVMAVPDATRADIIANRFKVFLNSKPSAAQLRAIRVDKQNGDYVVRVPMRVGLDVDGKPVTWLVTADPTWAAMKNYSAQGLARLLATEIQNGIAGKTPTAAEDHDAEYFLGQADTDRFALSSMSPGSREFEEVKQRAIEEYNGAIARDPLLMDGWINLARLYLTVGDKQNCQATIVTIHRFLDGAGSPANGVVEHNLTLLETDLKNAP